MNKREKKFKYFINLYTCGTKDENDKFCFSLPAKYAGKKFTPKIVKQLMEKGETEVYELTSKRTKKKYRAKFTYDLETNKIEMKRSEEHTSELQSRGHLVCRLLLEKKNK